MLRVGIDVGSTTMKVVAVDESGKLIYSAYERHYSEIFKKAHDMLTSFMEKVGDQSIMLALSGSAGMGLSEQAELDFVQEVYATRLCALTYLPSTDVIIELGGEDAKILFLKGGLEVRMNGTCAGGTGAFIDQMATLLGISRDDIDNLAKNATEVYTIASRCGVFAKSDIQPLINQGAKTEDIALSILFAVVNQTIAGLAQGRKIEGNVVYLGGPLTFIPTLRKCFDQQLRLVGTCPENSLYYVALGTALSAKGKGILISTLINKISSLKGSGNFIKLHPLFESQEEYDEFRKRHEKATVPVTDARTYKGKAYLGVDAGSTTIKCALIDENANLLLSRYGANNGNPVQAIASFLSSVYSDFPDIEIAASASTGYGEDLLKAAFNLDYGLVETEAHFLGAKHFLPSVDFIIDIGGQDIKCFKIRDGAIDDIFLNEACSSGCGSFLQTFANALGKSSQEFSSLALFAKNPVDLGSRCTVFMNSSVKQAQKDGADISDISAGLAISVVKNALYKVIRATRCDQLGKNIVVQGGTFLNDAVLRAFEMEMQSNVIRPTIAGLMGAFGAALYARMKKKNDRKQSSIINKEELDELNPKLKSIRCQGCSNRCILTINDFGLNRRLISGNKCDKPITGIKKKDDDSLNMYLYKQELLKEYMDKDPENRRGTLGLPLQLGLYDLLPFYQTLFSRLGFKTVVSPFGSRSLYISGQASIPSDTVCFPAKLMHGAVENLKEKNVDYIFIPASSYNVDEKKGNNHYNCPVVAYYGEVIKSNQDLGSSELKLVYLSLEHKKAFSKNISAAFSIPERLVRKAFDDALFEQERFRKKILDKGKEIIEKARKEKRQIIVLSGRPYHVDPEINHGIDRMIVSLGAAVISEDSISYLEKKKERTVLNQWTYHARMYDAAEYILDKKDMNLVQLVSFGCGLDAVTTDEVRQILRSSDKIYTQIKIDEITNLGAVKIRMRSLFAALELEEEEK